MCVCVYIYIYCFDRKKKLTFPTYHTLHNIYAIFKNYLTKKKKEKGKRNPIMGIEGQQQQDISYVGCMYFSPYNGSIRLYNSPKEDTYIYIWNYDIIHIEQEEVEKKNLKTRSWENFIIH